MYHWIRESYEFTIRLGKTGDFPSLDQVREAIVSQSDSLEDSIFNEDLFWKRNNHDLKVNFDTVSTIIKLGSELFLKFFTDPDTSLLPDSFYSTSPQYSATLTSYFAKVIKELESIDNDPSNTCQPAARLLYYSHQIKIKQSTGIPIICVDFMNLATQRVVSSTPILNEASSICYYLDNDLNKVALQICRWFDAIPELQGMIDMRQGERTRDVATSIWDSIAKDRIMKSAWDGTEAANEVKHIS